MNTIPNKWIEKQKKKKGPETAPAYEFSTKDTWIPVGSDKTPKRHTNAARATYRQTLRGIRK
jgi:hypothetical protein